MPAEILDPSTAAPEAAARLARVWRGYARKVYGRDYPLYSSIAAGIAEDPYVLGMIMQCRPAAHDPNMLLAAVQYLVLGGASDPLAALYEGADSPVGRPLPDDVPSLVNAFCRQHREELIALMNSRHVQTNETGRCGGIALGLAEAARHIGEPIALIDDGASAGLNLALDDYLLDFGAAGRLGPEDSPVRLRCEILGGGLPGPLRLPVIGRRLGIDRAPVDLGDGDSVRWMLACIWPGTGRQARARAAIRMHDGRRGLVRPGDMVLDLAPALAELRPLPTVVVTSWSYGYLPVEERDAFREVLATEAGRRPVAWVCCDLMGTVPMFDPAQPPPAGEATPSVLGLAVFRGGEVEAHPLAYMHSHGAWLSWAGIENT